MKFASTLLLLLLLTSLAASAASAKMIVNKFTNDFAVSSPYTADVKACSCENGAEPITVTNTGGFPTDFTVSIVADQNWYQLSPAQFSLAPGDSQTILVYTEPGCSVTGEYEYSIKIDSSYGRERILTRNLNLQQCQNIFLTVAGPNTSNLCQPLTFHAQLKNVAEFPDTYHLDLGSFNDYTQYSGGSQDTYLVPDQAAAFNVTVTPPCSLYGDITIPFTITSQKNGVTEQRPQSVVIQNQFDHEIVANTTDETCSRIPSEYTFGVHNLINVSNTYDIIVTGPGFMNYEPKELNLSGLEEKNVTVTLNPAKGQEGAYTLHLLVNSQLGNIQKTRDVALNVMDCYAFSTGFVNLPTDTSGAYTDQTCCGEKTYTLNIRNSGQAEEIYNIDVDGPTWFAPEEKTIRLQPGENQNVKIDAQLPCTDDNYEIPVTVSLIQHPSISDTVTFKVESETQQTCHAVTATTGNIKLNEETKIIPFIIKNTGLEGGAYAVQLKGALYNDTLEHEISLAPGEEKVLHFTTVGNLTDYFDGKYLAGLTVTYEPLNLTYDQPFWTRLSHTSWLTKAWRTATQYDYAALPPCLWLALLLLLVAIGAVVWLILLLNGKGRTLQTQSFSQNTLLLTRGVLILLLLAAVLWLSLAPLPPKADLYAKPTNDTTGLVFQWYENEQFKVDLNHYFTDPDNDTLQFTATQPAHVAVTIEGNVATLTPEHNWAGDDQIVFTANDEHGGITDSPILELRVLQQQHLTLLQWINRYCTQVILSLATIILVLLLLIAFLCKPRPETHEGASSDLTPPHKPGERKSKTVHTIVTKGGTVQPLGATTTTTQPAPTRSRGPFVARPGQVFTYTDAQGRTHTLGVAEPFNWPKQRRTTKRGNKQLAAKPGQIFTYTDEQGKIHRLGIAEPFIWPAQRTKQRNKNQALTAKPGQAFTYTDAQGRTRTLGVAERIAWPEAKQQGQARSLMKPGETITCIDEYGQTQVLGVAERLDWPEKPGAKVDKGATVNIAVGTPATAAAIREPAERILVGAKNGNKVHDPQCIIAQRIPRKNRVTFTNKKDALKAGYGPCKVCQAFDKA